MSKWGSLLQGAVANLESRLDTILAEDKEAAQKNTRVNNASKPQQPHMLGVSRTSSIKKAKTSPVEDSPRISVDGDESLASHPRTSSRLGSRERSTSRNGVRRLDDTKKTISDSLQPINGQSEVHLLNNSAKLPAIVVETGVGDLQDLPGKKSNDEMSSADLEQSKRVSFDSITSDRPTTSYEVASDLSTSNGNESYPEEAQELILQLRRDRAQAETQWQEESHAHLERIDALQAKVQYLVKESLQSAQNAESEVPKDSLEHRLAAKDKQIALLMEEGQKLSKLEVSQAGVIRRLRVKAAEETRELVQIKQKLSRTEQARESIAEKLVKSEADQKDAITKVLRNAQLEKELQTLRQDVKTKQSAIDGTRGQLEQEQQQRLKLQQSLDSANQSLAVERKTVQSLRDDLEATKFELRQSEEKARGSLRIADTDLRREKERSKTVEANLRGEVQVLEGRLEALRNRSEEVSTGNNGDAQAKFMRHIETLQTQYALARENWQGIESSLQSRITALESEKDDASKHEVETRRKARDSSNAVRHLRDELETTTRHSKVLEQEISERKATADRLQERAAEFEKNLREAQESFVRERQSWEASLSSRIEEERVKWQQEQPRWSGAESPVMSHELPMPLVLGRKASNFDRPTFPMRRNMSGRFGSPDLGVSSIDTRTLSRRTSAMRLHSMDWTTPPTPAWENGHSPSIMSPTIQTPSIHTVDQDEMFDGSSSPHRTPNDMISVSTVAAGPSVQLVERMSATVRRLESEKAASKDEVTRLLTQRDEARQEVVSLMREVGEKRAVDAKAQKSETDLAELTKRYQTTLEMLGEKSEQVEELRADVADLKKIYRELADSTMK